MVLFVGAVNQPWLSDAARLASQRDHRVQKLQHSVSTWSWSCPSRPLLSCGASREGKSLPLLPCWVWQECLLCRVWQERKSFHCEVVMVYNFHVAPDQLRQFEWLIYWFSILLWIHDNTNVCLWLCLISAVLRWYIGIVGNMPPIKMSSDWNSVGVVMFAILLFVCCDVTSDVTVSEFMSAILQLASG